MTRYRLDRSHLMVLAGVCFIVAAVGVLVAFLTGTGSDLRVTVTILGAVVAVVALLVAAVMNLRPPTVVTLDPAGFVARGRHGDVTWKQVESVGVSDGMLRFTDGTGAVTAFPLSLVDRTRHAELIREVYDRLNQANGYRRFDLAEG
ncbi:MULTISPECIES: hypothetical protein [Aeromicrobium]|uniref:hypothetical protein n=1 Tax=Aeromicrobium TaxID=2040 RepID=UPI00257FE71E|nr:MULTISPECIES: hypothetical protein [Aeromicrobium]